MLSKKSKLLSFVMNGRNDDYGQSFKKRLSNTLNCLAKNAKKCDAIDDIEIILVDWGSSKSTGTLADGVLEVGEDAQNIVRVIEVSEEIVKKNKYATDDYFNAHLATNVGIRRALGEFILFMPGDVIYSYKDFFLLISFLKGELFYEIDIDIKKLLINIEVNFEIPQTFWLKDDFEERFFRKAFFRRDDKVWIHALGGGYGGFLLHKNIIWEMQGLDEKMCYWGWADNDLFFRITCNYPWLRSGAFGFCCAHQQHDKVEVSGRPINRETINRKSAVNNENWGLGAEIFTERKIVAGKLEKFKNSITKIEKSTLLNSLLQCSDVTQKNKFFWHNFLRWFNANYRPDLYLHLGYRQMDSFINNLILSDNDDIEQLLLINVNKIIKEDENNTEARQIVYDEYSKTINGYLGQANVFIGTAQSFLNKFESVLVKNIPYEIDFIYLNLDEWSEDEQLYFIKIYQMLSATGIMIVTSKNVDTLKSFTERPLQLDITNNYWCSENIYLMPSYNMNKENIQAIRETIFFINNTLKKNLFIFGAGYEGQKLLSILQSSDIVVEAFIDNDREKKGKLIRDVPVTDIDYIKQIKNKTVIIASDWCLDIKKQLLELGLQEGNEFIIWKGGIL